MRPSDVLIPDLDSGRCLISPSLCGRIVGVRLRALSVTVKKADEDISAQSLIIHQGDRGQSQETTCLFRRANRNEPKLPRRAQSKSVAYASPLSVQLHPLHICRLHYIELSAKKKNDLTVRFPYYGLTTREIDPNYLQDITVGV